MQEILDGQVGLFDLDTWSGRTSPEPSAPTAGKTSRQSSKRSSASSKTKSPICLQLFRGGWTKSGCLYDEMGTWSVAWRVHDAQFWGVPQRRKRIALVADFGGLSAPEILFERKGLSGDTEPGGAQREGTAAGTEGGAGSAISFQERAGKPGGGKGILIQREHIGALSTLNNQSVYSIGSFNSEGMKSENPSAGVYETDMARTIDLTGGNPAGYQGGIAVVEPILLESNQNHATVQTDGVCTALPAAMGMGGGYVPMIAGTLDANYYKGCGERQGVEREVVLCVGNGQLNQMSMAEQANTLDTMHDQQAVLCFDKEMYNCGERMTGEPQARYDSVSPTVRADSHPSGVCTSTVRRLTPLECERLQGYPDGWTDIGEWTDSKGKKHKEADSPRYKALGNSIALPFWAYLARRICAQYERTATMASLFDGIGGFPLCFQRSGAVPVWASEIEEFCVAVTKIRFPEVGNGN